MSDEDRLDRIERKLDRLSEAVVAIARTEEQIATLFGHFRTVETHITQQSDDIKLLRERYHTVTNRIIEMSVMESKVRELDNDVNTLLLDVHDHKLLLTRVTRLGWIVLTILAGVLVDKFIQI